MHKGIKKKEKGKNYKTLSWFEVVKISPYLESTTCGRLTIFLCQKLMVCNRLAMVMGGVF